MFDPTELLTPENSEILRDEILPEALHMDHGWQFVVGDPEIYENMDRLLVPAGKALDVGIGLARSSLCLALNGMVVEGFDLDKERVEIINGWRDKGVPISAEVKDITNCRFGRDKYDTTIFSQTFIHFPNTELAYKVMKKGIAATKVGGHIYLRTVGTLDSMYSDHEECGLYPTEAERSKADPNVIYDWCGCSGEPRFDPHLFLNPFNLMVFLTGNGIKIVYSQTAPQYGEKNVMYGENWHTPVSYYEQCGMITLIGEKVR